MDELEELELKKFGQKLIQIRKAKGVSQEKLSIESSITRSYLSGIENGRRNLSLLHIIKLAKTLGVKPTELLEPPQDEVES